MECIGFALGRVSENKVLRDQIKGKIMDAVAVSIGAFRQRHKALQVPQTAWGTKGSGYTSKVKTILRLTHKTKMPCQEHAFWLLACQFRRRRSDR